MNCKHSLVKECLEMVNYMNIKNESKMFINKLWFKIPTTIIISIIVVMFFSTLFPITKAEKGVTLEKFTFYLDERIPEIMEAYDIPGASIALVEGGETIWTKAYGYADLETGRKMTTDTLLRVESISKSVTAWGVMKLVEQGKIELNRPVNQYIKSWKFPKSEFEEEEITVKHLLSHTSGLPLGDFTKRYSPTKEIPSLKDSLSMEAILEQKPGISFSYSNVGFNLLELLIEELTACDFSEYMKREILIPLRMNNSSYTWSEDFNPAVPFGYDLTGEAVPVYVYPEKGSGGLFATVEDVALFVAAGMPSSSQNHKVLSTQSINMLYNPTAEKLGIYNYVFHSYGLGYYIENLLNGKQAVSHGGQGAGWMTHFHSVPETGDGIVILTNSQRSWPFIAYILSDWAVWSGISPIGMSRIIWGLYALWTLIALIWLILLWQVWGLVEEFTSKKGRFKPLSKDLHFSRIVQSALAIVLIAVLLWSTNQDYLFVSSVFPIASSWLGISIFIFAAVLLLSALFRF